MADTLDKTRDGTAPDYVNALLTEGSSPQNLMDYLNRQMVPVPDFTPPSPRGDNVCQIPAECSQESAYEFRSAGVLLQALAAEARAWSEKLPPEYRPAIVAILHGGLQIEVRTLAQVSFDGIRIEGLMGDSPCSLLAHQGTVQLVCHAVLVNADEQEQHRPIGFIWPDRDEQV
jgi:hypothetical protein